MAEIQKMNHGKPDLARVLDCPVSLAGLAASFAFGEQKDGRTRLSWKQYNDKDGLMSATLRHLSAWQNGEIIDSESGLNHLAHALTNIVMLYETNPGTESGELKVKSNDYEERDNKNNGRGPTIVYEPGVTTGAGKCWDGRFIDSPLGRDTSP